MSEDITTPAKESRVYDLSRVHLNDLILAVQSRLSRLSPMRRDGLIQQLVEPFVVNEVDMESDSYTKSPVDHSSPEASEAADRATVEGSVCGTRVYAFNDFYGLGKEWHDLTTAAAKNPLVNEEIRPLMNDLVEAASVVMDALSNKKAQDAMMAEDLIMMSLALTGKARAEALDEAEEGYFDEDQHSVGAWVKESFPHFIGSQNRALGCVEEAIKLAYASGCDPTHIANVFKVVAIKQAQRSDPGDPEEEAGDLQILLWAYCEDRGILAEEEAEAKMALNRSRPLEYYLERTKQKLLMGMPLVETTEPGGPPAPQTENEEDEDDED